MQAITPKERVHGKSTGEALSRRRAGILAPKTTSAKTSSSPATNHNYQCSVYTSEKQNNIPTRWIEFIAYY